MNKRGRPRKNKNQHKQIVSFTLSKQVVWALAKEPNKSGLVNSLLARHYGLKEKSE